MCFSAEASFAVGAALIPAGAYCIWASAVKKPSYLGLAALPLFFGIQQISEGFVWQALNNQDTANIRGPSLFFLFFALAFWPFWFPFLTTLMEPEPRRRWFFLALTILASGWFWVLYFPLLTGPEGVFKTYPEHHSIRYDYYDSLAIYQYVPQRVLQVLYFACVALPMALSTQSLGRIPGLALGVSALVAALLYNHAFVSVWCFFAAVMSIYCCVMFYRLPYETCAHQP